MSFLVLFSRTAPLRSSLSETPSQLSKLGLLLYASMKRRNLMMSSHPRWTGLRNHLLSLSVSILGYAFVSGIVAAADSPLELIRSTTNQALHVLTDSSGGGNSPSQPQLEKMW